jgi:hypothetical protein
MSNDEDILNGFGNHNILDFFYFQSSTPLTDENKKAEVLKYIKGHKSEAIIYSDKYIFTKKYDGVYYFIYILDYEIDANILEIYDKFLKKKPVFEDAVIYREFICRYYLIHNTYEGGNEVLSKLLNENQIGYDTQDDEIKYNYLGVKIKYYNEIKKLIGLSDEDSLYLFSLDFRNLYTIYENIIKVKNYKNQDELEELVYKYKDIKKFIISCEYEDKSFEDYLFKYSLLKQTELLEQIDKLPENEKSFLINLNQEYDKINTDQYIRINAMKIDKITKNKILLEHSDSFFYHFRYDTNLYSQVLDFFGYSESDSNIKRKKITIKIYI